MIIAKKGDNNERLQIVDFSNKKFIKRREVIEAYEKLQELEKINAFAPLGNITGGSPGRSYIGVKEGTETPIFAPADMILENIIMKILHRKREIKLRDLD